MDRNTARSEVDAYYADILDIPALRDSHGPRGAYGSTEDQILRLQNPTQNLIEDDSVYMDRFFNNSPYVRRYRDGEPYRDSDGVRLVTDTRNRSTSVPEATVLELWAGEMRALSRKEMSGEPLSPKEAELLRSYQEYFSGRTGMAEGGVVTPQADMSGISGLFADKAIGGGGPGGLPAVMGPSRGPSKPLESRESAVGLSLFQQAGIQASPEQLTQLVDDAIFAQLDRIMARSQRDEMSRVPDTYFPQDGRGTSAPQY